LWIMKGKEFILSHRTAAPIEMSHANFMALGADYSFMIMVAVRPHYSGVHRRCG
jgi:hypothetical protein